MRIAIIEDDPSQLELVCHWLRSAGHEAFAFQDANAFLKIMVQTQFEMVILDWNLGEVTGVDVLSRLRQTSKVPVVQRQLDLLMATIIFADWSRRS